MTRSLQEITAELQSLDLSGKGIKRYYELSAELYALLPGAQAQAILSEGLRGRKEELLLALASDVGDQRAKDLIDRSDGEDDPKRAIALLHRALRYGRTSIQAQKAYSGLGMRYESRGNISRAIMYYTKALDIDTDAQVLFWRGQLYYQQGQFTEARHDFEQALALKQTALLNYLFEDQREIAEQYLAQLKQVSDNEPA